MWKFLSFLFLPFSCKSGHIKCRMLPLCLVTLVYLSHLVNCSCHHWMMFTFFLIRSFHSPPNKQNSSFVMSAFLVETQIPQLHINRNAWDTFSKHTSVLSQGLPHFQEGFFPNLWQKVWSNWLYWCKIFTETSSQKVLYRMSFRFGIACGFPV